jgi:hypothetical protein
MNVAAISRAWLAAGVQPAEVELLSECIARGGGDVAWIELADTVLQWLSEQGGGPALALLLLDIAERMALDQFVPEIPSLLAKADRSGEDARRVGTARHLRG